MSHFVSPAITVEIALHSPHCQHRRRRDEGARFARVSNRDMHGVVRNRLASELRQPFKLAGQSGHSGERKSKRPSMKKSDRRLRV
jgi:hypothetical protein